MDDINRSLERGMEAERLSIYFEELGAYHYKRNQEIKNNIPSPEHSPGQGETIVSAVIGDDEE